MLELNSIRKTYPAGDGHVEALKGVSLRFREAEFVSILGPSGCGKTTLLNIVGGLDQYTAGDLIINGTSTKDFKDRDWDTYRNHSIGFVFQSYNLIPHQTVLQNVELALTLSGVSKSERRKRAAAALEAVGLGDQLRKKPSQMSGGQMQRVAIARALVNNPDIILADEPTGALDTETSVQVMDILKEVAKDRLVIMVTHNPELAERYSTRIIRMLDGLVQGDSDPIRPEELTAAASRVQEKPKKERKPSMSLLTAFGLSLKNLISKKGRTALTSFAGSIGIIGIALIYAVSQGMTTYINVLQEDTLSSYPLTIEATHTDISSLMSAFISSAEATQSHELDAIYTKPAVYAMGNAPSSPESTENDLTSFKTYLDTVRLDEDDPMAQAISGIRYGYNLDPQVYTKDTTGTIIPSDTTVLMRKLMGNMAGAAMESSSSGMAGMMGGSGGMMSANLWQEMLPGENGALISPLLEKQYDMVYGRWPAAWDEIVLVVDQNQELDDMTLYALGLKSEADMRAIMQAAINQTGMEPDLSSWSYEEICAMEFRTVLPGDFYVYDAPSGTYMDLRASDAGLRYLYDQAATLKVTGIIKPSEDAVSTMLTGSIGYTTALTQHVIGKSHESAAAQAQKRDPLNDIFTGLPFRDSASEQSDAAKETAFREYVAGLDTARQAEAFRSISSIPTQQQLDAMVAQSVGAMTRADMEAAMAQAMSQQMGMDAESILAYTAAMSDQELTDLFRQMAAEQAKVQYAAQVRAKMANIPEQQLAAALQQALPGYTTAQCAQYYDEVLEFSESSLEENLVALGCLELSAPSAIHLYAATFESKDVIEAAIAHYNDDVPELSRIRYTDYVGLMMSSVTSIINAITYVLIAFVAISLVVSSIMIGVITLISVQERTKEIGILRAIGASKKNVSSMFTAETALIGFAAGCVGIGATVLLCFPINAIVQHLTGIPNLEAYLPWQVACVLVVISVVLTLMAGVIPSRSAAKKDPVVALRTE